ncbi:MAG: hypothetical protein OJF59_002340 [Cytophagales bacterium]|jgi:hypothetical protein|nr:DUF4136 domain-containing protein [Bacteroidota bacterium]MBS1981479.1 DUF4136 domain-containing protein [Bacteroidota bacterium]WHZ08586.1 MAG: hypothetical protein OJF59_002340 [Cytophagales bacterium]
MKFLVPFFLFISTLGISQEIKIEYDKKHDFSKYKTFSFGESQINIPSDQKELSKVDIEKWIKSGVKRELEYKGLKKIDSLGDLIISYVLITEPRYDVQQLGPGGLTPNSSDRTFTRNYTENTLVIDLNNRSNYLVWRINAVDDVMGKEAERTIDLIIVKGLRKFGKFKKK